MPARPFANALPRGIVHTIKDGIVIENANLMRDVEALVREAKKTMPMDVVRAPWK